MNRKPLAQPTWNASTTLPGQRRFNDKLTTLFEPRQSRRCCRISFEIRRSMGGSAATSYFFSNTMHRGFKFEAVFFFVYKRVLYLPDQVWHTLRYSSHFWRFNLVRNYKCGLCSLSYSISLQRPDEVTWDWKKFLKKNNFDHANCMTVIQVCKNKGSEVTENLVDEY